MGVDHERLRGHQRHGPSFPVFSPSSWRRPPAPPWSAWRYSSSSAAILRASPGSAADRERLDAAEAELAESRCEKVALDRQLSEKGRRLASLKMTAQRAPKLER